MKCLYIFNPENDMALAYGGPYFMPPANALKMAHDLAALPMWYAFEGGDVWLPDISQIEWMKNYCPFAMVANGVVNPFLTGHYQEVRPWGWSNSMAHRLHVQGANQELCPSSSWLERIRVLSARGTSLHVLHTLNFPHSYRQAQSISLYSDVEAFVHTHGKVLLKAPWSGSGRGVQFIEERMSVSLQGWVNHILKTQGYVIAEPFYDKVVDFAMEFKSSAQGGTFAGYSWFETDSRGIYKENILASDEKIEEWLSCYVDREMLYAIRQSLEEKLSEVIDGVYVGYLGVDMMVCRTDGGYTIHPCVEINLRMNMGITSRLIFDHYVHPDAQGRFVVEYYPTKGEALRTHLHMQQIHPLVIEGQRIKKGYLSLTPVFGDTTYQVYVVIG